MKRARSSVTLTPAPHPDKPKGAGVRLQPALRMSGDPVPLITRMIISPNPRTPSPYGNRMGDHTIAWQVHLDALKSAMPGLTLQQAITLLRDMRNERMAWIRDDGTEGGKLLLTLADQEQRIPLLADAMFLVDEWLMAAGKHLSSWEQDKAVHAFCLAAAHQLTFVNYLPYSTVRNLSARGSIGSGEGRHRAVVVGFERQCLARAREEVALEQARAKALVDSKPRPADLPPLQVPPGLKDALWGLFSFEAALRETGLIFILVPDTLKQLRGAYDQLSTLSEGVVNLYTGTRKTVMLPDVVVAKAKEVYDQYSSAKDDEHLFHAAMAIKNAAASFQNLSQETKGQRKKAGIREQKIIGKYLGAALVSLGANQELAATAPTRLATIMLNLLHEHQQLTLQAYPCSVIASGFLAPSPAQAAVSRLRAEIKALYPGADLGKKTFTDVMDAITTGYPALKVPAKATPGLWVDDADNDPLVVTYQVGKPLVVNGRPPAPAAVGGMGCHTSAWVIQWNALSKLLQPLTGAAAARASLEEAVTNDLASPVMALDKLLPLDQLEGGQLMALFEAAQQAIDAASVDEAATAYLTFRNLLPFATVDAGDRGGHGESMQATEHDTFDAEALRVTANLLETELAAVDSPYGKRLTDVAGALESALDDDETEWITSAVVRGAAQASAARLRSLARNWRRNPPVNVATTIVDTRREEHRLLYARAHS